MIVGVMCEKFSIQCAVFSKECAVYSTDCEFVVLTTNCAVTDCMSRDSAVEAHWNAAPAPHLCSVQCAVCSVQCAVCRV